MGWFDESGNGEPADVGALMDSKVPVLLAELVQLGALVSLGTTSDGGTVGFTVTLDGRWRRDYFRESEPAAEWLAEAIEAVRDESSRRPASSGRRQRSRRS